MAARSLASGPKFMRHLQASLTTFRQGIQTQVPDSVESPLPDVETRSSKTRIDLDFEELHDLLSADNSILIDVRTPSELDQSGSIPGSVHIPLKQIKTALQLSEDTWARHFQSPKPSKLDNKNLVFYARGPNASSAAVEIAHRLGFKDSRRYTGGWADYCDKMGIPLKKANKN